MKSRSLRFLVAALLPTVAAFWLASTTVPLSYAAQSHQSYARSTDVFTRQDYAPTNDQQDTPVTRDAIAPYRLPEITTIYFSQTQHHVSNRSGFLDFWRANGQKYVLGYPITEEIVENGRVVQYFEKARLEHHPDMAGTEWEVQVGHLGKMIPTEVDMTPVADLHMEGVVYFGETSHTLRGEFLQYWEKRGGVQIFGFPISEEVVENGRTVQYFERARLEYHPEDMDPFYRAYEYYGRNLNTLHEVIVSDLGRQYTEMHGINTAPVKQLAGSPEWTPALWARHIEVNLTEQWLTAYEDDLIVYRAPVTTGRPGFYTPVGTYSVYDKLPIQTMRGSMFGETWNVPNIPWVMYVNGSVAMHGTYWHNLFGSGALMSHGCINLPMDDAQWIYEWNDIGTTVNIHY